MLIAYYRQSYYLSHREKKGQELEEREVAIRDVVYDM
jgi:hypothetical protein